MGKLQLTFSGRRTNQEDELGAFIKVNLNNGNTIVSPSVVQALGLKPKSKLNVAVFGDDMYFGENQVAGYALDKKCKSTTSMSLAKEIAFQFKDEIGDNEVVILNADIENIQPAEDQEGNDINVVQLSFLKAMPARVIGGSSDEVEEEEMEEAEV